MSTMNAAIMNNYGNPAKESLVTLVEKPKIQAVEEDSFKVLVQVKAAALNPIDYKIVEGVFSDLKPVSFPRSLGFDLSGVVTEVGSKVTRFSVGDEVFGDTGGVEGSLAEYVKADEKWLHLKPSKLSHVEAAATPLVALTSYQALIHHGGLREGEKVLVLGGTSSTGAFGIQLAKSLGAGYIATTASDINRARSYGADQVINYREDDWGEILAGQEYDLIYDCVGGNEEWVRAQRVLKPSGRFISLVGDLGSDRLTKGKLLSLIGANIRRSFRHAIGWSAKHKAIMKDNKVGDTDLDELAKLLEREEIKPMIEASSPLKFNTENVRNGFKHLMSHRAKGKIVIEM